LPIDLSQDGVFSRYPYDNAIIDPCFLHWPEGTSIASATSSQYGPALWKINETGDVVVTISQDTDTPSSINIPYSCKLDCTTSDAGGDATDLWTLQYAVTGPDMAVLFDVGEITFSFWIKSTVTGTFVVAFRNGDNDRSYPATYTVDVSDTWEQKTITIDLSAETASDWNTAFTTADVGMYIFMTFMAGSNHHGTANTWQAGNVRGVSGMAAGFNNTANNIFIAAPQLHPGTVALPFTAPPAASTENRVSWYVRKGGAGMVGQSSGTTEVFSSITFENEMRATPTPINIDEQAGKELSYIVNEMKKVPAGYLGFVPDVAMWASKKILGQPTNFGEMTRKFQALTPTVDPNLKPPNRGAEKIGIFATQGAASLPFAAGAFVKGSSGMARGGFGALTEISSGVGAGAGQLVGQHFGPWGEVMGALAGGITGYRAGNVLEQVYPLGKEAVSFVGGLTNKASREAQRLKAQGVIENSPEWIQAMDVMAQQSKVAIHNDLLRAFAEEDIDLIRQKLVEYETIEKLFPGFKSSIGEITGNDAALGFQRKLESRNIEALEERGSRIRGNQAAIESGREALVPPAVGASQRAMRAVEGSVEAELHGLKTQTEKLAGDLEAQTAKTTDAAISQPLAGAEIKAASAEGYKRSKGIADKKYNDFREAVTKGDDSPVDVSSISARVEELRAKFTFDQEPSLLKIIPKSTEDAPAQLSVLELDDLSSAAKSDARRIGAQTNPDRKAIARLTEIGKEADQLIESTLSGRGNVEALTKYRDAQKFFKERHIPEYRTGINLTVRARNAVNEQRIKPEQVVTKYFTKDGTTEAQRFNAQFADNGPAKEVLARGVLDLYRKEVIEATGLIEPKAHARFMAKYERALNEYPWIKKRLDKNNVSAEIAKRVEEKRAVMGEVSKSQVAKIVKDGDVESFMTSVATNRKALIAAAARMKPEQRKDLAIAMLNEAWDLSPTRSSDAMNKFFATNKNLRDILVIGFGTKEGTEHFNNLQRLKRAMELNETAPATAPMQAITEDTMKAKTGTSSLQIFSALRAVGRRPGSLDWFLGVMGMQFAKAKVDAQKNAILKQHLFDPEMLADTLEMLKQRKAGAGTAAIDASAAAKRAGSKLWDLTKKVGKAVLGEGAPTAGIARAIPAVEPSLETVEP